MVIDFSTPLQGMQNALDRLNTAGRQIAQAADPNAGDGVDLSAAAVALLEARNAFAANVNVAKTVDELNRSLVDLLA